MLTARVYCCGRERIRQRHPGATSYSPDALPLRCVPLRSTLLRQSGGEKSEPSAAKRLLWAGSHVASGSDPEVCHCDGCGLTYLAIPGPWMVGVERRPEVGASGALRRLRLPVLCHAAHDGWRA